MNDAALDRRLRDGVLALTAHRGSGDWDAVVKAATTAPKARRRLPRGRYAALFAAGALALGATFGSHDWISSQFDTFRASSGIDMRGAVVVSHLRQHDGSILEIAEKTVPPVVDANPVQSTPAQRCVATRPPAPADPVTAPADPLSFGGDAFCTALSTMASLSAWLDDGSASMLARRPDAAASIEIRLGSSVWQPSSADGPWVIFTVGPGSIPPHATVELIALDASGHPVATERVEWS
jgi:hypothetical protein